jgi:hypothetical protein
MKTKDWFWSGSSVVECLPSMHKTLDFIPDTAKRKIAFVFIQGMKEQKLKAKKKRDEEIEAERQNLDVEEEIYKQGERKKAIENAKQYQFYQTERVKNFNVLFCFSFYIHLTCIINCNLCIITHHFLKILPFFL